MKKVIVLFALLSMLTSFTACQEGNSDPINQSSASTQTSSVDTETSSLEVQPTSKKGNIDVQASLDNLEDIETKNWTSYAATKTNFDPAFIKNYFLKDKTIYSEESFPDHVMMYSTTENDNLTVNNGNIYFMTNYYYKTIYSIANFIRDTSVDSSRYITGEDLSFMTEEEARAQALSICNDLGLSNMRVENVYIVSYNDQNAEGGPAMKKCYYLTLRENIDSIDMISEYPLLTPYISSVYTDVVFSDRGIEYFSVLGHYSIDEKEAEQPIIRAEEATEIVKQNHSQETFTIQEVSLQYVPYVVNKADEKYRLMPIWCFKTSQLAHTLGSREDIPEEIISSIFVDATTGQEIV